MTVVEETQVEAVTEAKETNGGSKYIIFRRVSKDRDVWEELGEVEADGAYAARMKGVQKYGLMDEVRSGECEIVSLGARFWAPKRPKVNVSESLDVS